MCRTAISDFWSGGHVRERLVKLRVIFVLANPRGRTLAYQTMVALPSCQVLTGYRSIGHVSLRAFSLLQMIIALLRQNDRRCSLTLITRAAALQVDHGKAGPQWAPESFDQLPIERRPGVAAAPSRSHPIAIQTAASIRKPCRKGGLFSRQWNCLGSGHCVRPTYS